MKENGPWTGITKAKKDANKSISRDEVKWYYLIAPLADLTLKA